MGTVPQQYFSFIMDYAPYFYVIPGTGVDTEWGRGPAAAAHAIDFLSEAYQSSQFGSQKTDIYNKIVELANYLASIQCTDDGKLAYGGFQSKDESTDYFSIDAMRAIPALLKAYTLTGTTSYLNAATLAGETFLYNMQHKPSELEIHDQYYGGFAQAVTITDEWLPEMHIVDLYGLIALKMLYNQTGETQIQTMIDDALGFYRSGFETLYSRFSPPPAETETGTEWAHQTLSTTTTSATPSQDSSIMRDGAPRLNRSTGTSTPSDRAQTIQHTIPLSAGQGTLMWSQERLTATTTTL
jgi:hypothetical protein